MCNKTYFFSDGCRLILKKDEAEQSVPAYTIWVHEVPGYGAAAAP